MSAVSQPLSHLVSLVIITHCSTDFLFHRTVSQGWTCVRAGLPGAVLESALTCALRFSQSSLKSDWWVVWEPNPAYEKWQFIYRRGPFPPETAASSPPHPSSGAQHPETFPSCFLVWDKWTFHSGVYFFLDVNFWGNVLFLYNFKILKKFQE